MEHYLSNEQESIGHLRQAQAVIRSALRFAERGELQTEVWVIVEHQIELALKIAEGAAELTPELEEYYRQEYRNYLNMAA